ncbi:hypothetical protein [Dankookia rubra]|nr:hypothetical protein [Dankookia rubra]
MQHAITRSLRAKNMTLLAAALGGAVLMTALSLALLPVTLAQRLFLDHFP